MNPYALTKQGRIAQQQRMQEHAAQQELEAFQDSQWQAGNTETRRQYLAGLEADRQARRKEADQLFDDRVKPAAMREWLVDHPGKSSRDFESVWPMLRQTLVEQERSQAFEAELATVREKTSVGILSF